MSQHVTQSPTDDTLLSEKQALYGGIVVSVLVVILAALTVPQVLRIVGDLVVLGIGLYFLGAIAQFWVSGAWRDGLTVKELTLALIWPVDMVRVLREGFNRQNMTAGFSQSAGSDDDSNTLLNQTLAVIVGVVLTVVGIGVLGWGILLALELSFRLLWPLALVYAVGFLYTYWFARYYKDGLTVGEMIGAAVWPVGLLVKIRTAVRTV